MRAWGTGIYQNDVSDEFLRKIVIISIAAAKQVTEAAGKKTFDPRTSSMPKDAIPIVTRALESARTPEEKLVSLDLACEMGHVAVIKELRKKTLDSLNGEFAPEKLMAWNDTRSRRAMLDDLVERCDDIMTRKRRSKPKFPKEWLALLLSKKNT